MYHIVPAKVADLRAIDNLRRRDQEAVGFLPMSRYEREVDLGKNTLLVLREGGEVIGYVFWTRGWPVAHIQQLVVRYDARRQERATALVECVEQKALATYRYGITCRVRLNLEAIEFWRALGWREIRLETGGRRGPLVRFYRELKPALLDLGLYLPGQIDGAGASLRRGFRWQNR